MSSNKRKRQEEEQLETLLDDNENTETKKTKKTVTFLNNSPLVPPVSQEFPLTDSLGIEHFQSNDEHKEARKQRTEEAPDKSEQWIKYNDDPEAYLNTYRNKGGVIDDVILKDLIRYYKIRHKKDIDNEHTKITFCGAAKCFAVIASTAAFTYLFSQQFGGKKRIQTKRRQTKRKQTKRKQTKRKQTKRRQTKLQKYK